jgi:hypothetical protein
MRLHRIRINSLADYPAKKHPVLAFETGRPHALHRVEVVEQRHPLDDARPRRHGECPPCNRSRYLRRPALAEMLVERVTMVNLMHEAVRVGGGKKGRRGMGQVAGSGPRAGRVV